MTDDDRYHLIGQLQRHEDAQALENRKRTFYPYRDSVGKLTIGWGRNIQDRGLSDEEADYLLANDIAAAEDDLRRAFPWFADLDSIRQSALVNIRFNVGMASLLTFTRALAALAHRQYGQAADEFFDSKWSTQVGARAAELCAQIRTGQWQTT